MGVPVRSALWDGASVRGIWASVSDWLHALGAQAEVPRAPRGRPSGARAASQPMCYTHVVAHVVAEPVAVGGGGGDQACESRRSR